MQSVYFRRIAAWAIFIIGFSLMLLGLIFLFGYVAGISRFSTFLSFLFVAVGSIFSVVAILLNKQPSYLFFTVFFFLVGLFAFISALGIIPRSFFFRAWPLLSFFCGIALLITGWRHYGAFHSKFVVPSCVFMILGLALLVFSFRIVTFSFRQFMLDWWPLLAALVGVILFLGSLGAKNNREKINQPKV